MRKRERENEKERESEKERGSESKKTNAMGLRVGAKN